MRSSLGGLLLLASFVLGCGSGLSDFRREAEPLGVVRGRVLDVEALLAGADGVPLRATVMWAGVPSFESVCGRFGFDEALAGFCPSPLRFVAGPVQASVEFRPDEDGVFDFPLVQLPPASAVVGIAGARIAYGSLVIAADTDGDGVLALEQPGWLRHPSEEPVLAASFHSLAAPQGRLAFREGRFIPELPFYPAPQCPEPPTGFSLLFAPPLLFPGLPCLASDLDDLLETPLLSPADARAFTCPGWGNAAFMPAPGDGPPFQGEGAPELVCLDADHLAYLQKDVPCPEPIGISLYGCWPHDHAHDCTTPEWDLREKRPEWWPCD
jgi:hypothetical protein